MAAKTWETDFRYPAMQASIRALGDSYHQDHFQYPGSFCIPIGEKPILGWTPGRVSLVAMVLGFALLGLGVWLGVNSGKEDQAVDNPWIMVLALSCSVAGAITFLLPAKLDRPIICWLLGERGYKLQQRSTSAETIACELSDSSPAGLKVSIDGDDHVLILFDEENHRLLIEGIGARYQVRAADVTLLESFEFMNYVGVRIVCQIDSNTQLQFAIARVSLLLEVTRQLPFLKSLRNKITNRLLEHSVQTLKS